MTTTLIHPIDHDFWRRGIFLPKSHKDENSSINFFFFLKEGHDKGKQGQQMKMPRGHFGTCMLTFGIMFFLGV